MKGAEVRDKLLNDGYKLSEIAQTMGITPQSLHKLLLSEDIKTGVLDRISKAINKPITYFFDLDTDEIEEIKLTNEIVSKRRLLYFLYQRIVDVSVLNTEYFNITNSYNDEKAADIINSFLFPDPISEKDSNERSNYIDRREKWKSLSFENKKLYNEELSKSVQLLLDIFFEKFNLLYKKVRGDIFI